MSWSTVLTARRKKVGGGVFTHAVAWYLIEAKEILVEEIAAVGYPFYLLHEMLLRTLEEARHDFALALDFLKVHKEHYFNSFGNDIMRRRLQALEGVGRLYPKLLK